MKASLHLATLALLAAGLASCTGVAQKSSSIQSPKESSTSITLNDVAGLHLEKNTVSPTVWVIRFDVGDKGIAHHYVGEDSAVPLGFTEPIGDIPIRGGTLRVFSHPSHPNQVLVRKIYTTRDRKGRAGFLFNPDLLAFLVLRYLL